MPRIAARLEIDLNSVWVARRSALHRPDRKTADLVGRFPIWAMQRAASCNPDAVKVNFEAGSDAHEEE